MINNISKFFSGKSKSKSAEKKLKLIGEKILDKTYKEIRFYL